MSELRGIDRKIENKSLLKWVAIIFLVWAIPSTVLWTGVYLFIKEECDRKDDQSLKAIENKLENIAYDSSRTRFFQNRFSELFKSLKGRPTNPVNNLQLVLDSFSKQFPEGMLDIYLFNGQSEILKTKGARKEHEDFLKLAISDYGESSITDAKTKEIGLLIPKPTQILKKIREQKDRALELGNPDRYSLCYFNYDKQVNDPYVAGMLIFVHYGRVKNSVILSETISENEREKFGYIDIEKSRLPGILDGTSLNSQFLNDYYKLHPTNRFRYDSRLICLNKLNDNCILVGASIINQPSWALLAVLALLFITASCFFLKFTYQVYVSRLIHSFNTRQRITWLFILCYICPLIAAGIITSQYLRELKSSLLAKEEYSNYSRLSEIDTAFSRFITSKLMEHRQLTKELSKEILNEELIVERLKQLCLANTLDGIHLVSSDSRILLSSDLMASEVRRQGDKSYEERQEILTSWLDRHAILTPKHIAYLFNRKSVITFPEPQHRTAAHRAFTKVVSSTANSAMNYYNRSRNIAVQLKYSSSDMLVEAVIESHSISLFQAAKTNISKFILLEGINESIFCYTDILPGPKGDAWYTYIATSNLDTFERLYLTELYNDIKVRKNEINRIFPDEDIRAISNYAYSPCFPSILEYKNFEAIIRQSANDSKTFTSPMILNGEKVYVSLLRGSYLKTYLLLKIFPESKIEKLYKQQVNKVIILFIVIMVMGLALARLMTRTLVLPIKDITNGVKAIANNNYDYRIKVRTENEFGIMTKAFNETAASLGKLNIKAKLKNYIFPEKEFRCGSYFIHAANATSKVFASDYFDYLKLKQGTYAIITANISGNDSTAIHLMAMMKTAFIVFLTIFPNNPEVVMSKINQIFQRYSKNQRVISCFIGILDPTNDNMLCCNAGQPYPMIFDVNKKEASFVDLPSTSIGLSGTMKYSKHEISLNNRILVLYSNGATNVTNNKGEELRENAFVDLVSNCLKTDCKNPADKILKEINSYSTNVPWREDISLITIQNSI